MDEVLDIAKKDYANGRHKAAIKKLQEFIASNPQSALGHVEIARNLLALDWYEESIAEAQRALKLEPQLAIPHLILAQAYWAKQRFKESEAEARKALEIEPDLAPAYGVLGLVATSQNRLHEAINSLRKCISIEPDESWYHVSLGVAYQMDGQHIAATAEYRCAFEIDQSFEAAWRMVLGHIARHRRLFNVVAIGSLLLMFLVRSPLTVPIIAFWTAFVIGNVVFHFRMGKRRNGLIGFLLLLALTVLYVYNLLYGL